MFQESLALVWVCLQVGLPWFKWFWYLPKTLALQSTAWSVEALHQTGRSFLAGPLVVIHRPLPVWAPESSHHTTVSHISPTLVVIIIYNIQEPLTGKGEQYIDIFQRFSRNKIPVYDVALDMLVGTWGDWLLFNCRSLAASQSSLSYISSQVVRFCMTVWL